MRAKEAEQLLLPSYLTQKQKALALHPVLRPAFSMIPATACLGDVAVFVLCCYDLGYLSCRLEPPVHFVRSVRTSTVQNATVFLLARLMCHKALIMHGTELVSPFPRFEVRAFGSPICALALAYKFLGPSQPRTSLRDPPH